MAGAESIAAVLDWRVGMLADVSVPARARGPLASLPPTGGPSVEVARQAGELMRERWRQIRATLAATTATLRWAAELGPQPAEREERSAWLTAATAVTAYRERFEVPSYALMVGETPSSPRPDAQAAWDHARLQADRYLARRLRHLTDEKLDELDRHQQAILANRFTFDPVELHAARLSRANWVRAATGPQRVGPLERAAGHHNAWRKEAHAAMALRQQIQVERERRINQQANRQRAAR